MSLQADEEWARRIYSMDTSIHGTVLRLSGRVNFRAHYTGDVLVYGETIPVTVRPEKVIEDSWPVIFIYDYRGKLTIPKVFDASDRLSRTRAKRKVSSRDMHLNDRPAESFCVAPKSELKDAFAGGFDLEKYFTQYLVPFLFQQSYFEKHGEWPWWNYPHGPLGDQLWRMAAGQITT